MASYKYEVVGADGKPKTGTIEAMNMEPTHLTKISKSISEKPSASAK